MEAKTPEMAYLTKVDDAGRPNIVFMDHTVADHLTGTAKTQFKTSADARKAAAEAQARTDLSTKVRATVSGGGIQTGN